MIHFKDPSATFIHIMKTGGTSFRNWTTNHIGKDRYTNYKNPLTHLTFEESKDHIKELGQVFTIVRNPFSRLVSLYNHLDAKPSIKGKMKSFDHFIEKVIENNNTTFINTRDYPIIQFDYIGLEDAWYIRLEHHKEEFKKIQDLLSCNKPFPHANKRTHKHYRKYYNKHTRKLVEEHCKKDLNKFNYEF